MTFAHLIDDTALEHGLSKAQVRRMLEYVVDYVDGATWADGRFMWPGLATFRVRERKARMVAMAHPDGGPSSAFSVPAHRTVTAVVAKSWRRR